MTAETVPCTVCHGRGHIYRSKDRCKRCNGKTTTEEKAILEVNIPKGALNGSRIVLAGKADEAYGQATGDIVVTVKEQEHEHFTRMGSYLMVKTAISLRESLTGFERVLVTHLDGRGLRVRVDRGTVTKPGTILKLKGKGMPHESSNGYGDLYIEVDVVFPDSLDPSTSLALEQALPCPPVYDEPNAVDDVDVSVVDPEDLPTYKEEDEEPEPQPSQCHTM